MSNNTDRLIATLHRWPGLDDDQLAVQASIHPRQQVNQICRRLERQGLLRRSRGSEGKLVNHLTGIAAQAPGFSHGVSAAVESIDSLRRS